MTVLSASRAPAFVLGSDFNDPTNERLIWLSAAGLVLVGLGLLVGTILWWRRGRQEHPVLAPLEVMSTRSWWKSPEGDRNRRLAKVRIAGHGSGMEEPIRSEPLDLQALVRSVPQAFDDLREPGEVAVDELPVAESPAVFAVAADGEVVAVSEPQPAPVVAEDAAAVEVGAVAEDAAAEDVDATAYAMERPVAPASPPPSPSVPPTSTNGIKPAVADVKDAGSGALASSHGDQP